jgi:hypothetical protein
MRRHYFVITTTCGAYFDTVTSLQQHVQTLTLSVTSLQQPVVETLTHTTKLGASLQ